MSELLSIEEVEKLAYKVWYAKFQEEAKVLLSDHKKSMDNEYSMLKKYKSEIYNMFEKLKSIQSDVNRKVNDCGYMQTKIIKGLSEIKEIKKKIEHTERKLSYALGEPYDKRNLKKEFEKAKDEEE